MKKIIILGLGVAAFFMQGCDFLDRTPEDIIETGKFFESANANALEQYCNDFYPKLINGHGAPKGYNSMLEDDWNSDNILPWEKNDVSFGHQIAVKNASDEGSDWKWENIRACNEFLMNYALIATVLFKEPGFGTWVHTWGCNMPMALCWQMLYCGPLARAIFRLVFRRGAKQAD